MNEQMLGGSVIVIFAKDPWVVGKR